MDPGMVPATGFDDPIGLDDFVKFNSNDLCEQ